MGFNQAYFYPVGFSETFVFTYLQGYVTFYFFERNEISISGLFFKNIVFGCVISVHLVGNKASFQKQYPPFWLTKICPQIIMGFLPSTDTP